MVKDDLNSLIADLNAARDNIEMMLISDVVVNKANDVLSKFKQSVLDSKQKWLVPHVTTEGDGNIVFEWFNDPKKLSVFVDEFELSYLKVWGINIHSDMEYGDIIALDEFCDLWFWFME